MILKLVSAMSLISLGILAPYSAFAIKIVGNGGDFYALEFIAVAQKDFHYLENLDQAKINKAALARALSETDVISTERSLTLDGIPKDAINYPSLKRIIFNRQRWIKASFQERPVLVLHEFLGIMGVDDAGYHISKVTLAGLEFGNFDRHLTPSEMKALLPQYMVFIKSQADTVPSAQEFDYVDSLASWPDRSQFSIFRNDKFIGWQTTPASDMLQALEYDMNRLRAVTTAARIQSAENLLADFQNPPADAKISCVLGYKENYPATNENRLALCVDDRRGRGTLRTFLLSVDGNTLAPLGVLKLTDHHAG